MTKRKSSSDRFSSVRQVAHGMAEQDQKAAEQASWKRTQKERQEDTRPLNSSHVDALSESIEVLGLLEPLVLDERNRLLAGRHRLAAIKRLQDIKISAYQSQFPDDLIPVRVMPFDADNEPERALQCEIAENEHRRDYTPAEVRLLANRLLQAGYTYHNRRPRKGEKALGSALAVVIGKHRRTVSRYLNEYLEGGGSEPQKTMTDVIVTKEIKTLRRIQKEIKKWQTLASSEPKRPKQAELVAKLPEFLQLLEGVLTEIEKTEEG